MKKLTYEEMTVLLNDMRNADSKGELKPLSTIDASSLKGHRIQTLYYGYRGQDGVDDFVVGDIITEYQKAQNETMEDGRTRAEYWEQNLGKHVVEEAKRRLCLMTEDGRDVYFRCYDNDNVFWCSDLDRFVFYREVK